MSAFTYAVSDSATMLRRNLRRMVRYPALIVSIVLLPIIFLLLFVFVLGSTLGAGLGGSLNGRADYVNYLIPGILVMTVAGAAVGPAISIAMDMAEGIMARFRTMAIARSSVLMGHVIVNMIQVMIGLVIVIAVSLLVGWRPTAGPGAWIAAIGLLMLLTFALTWLSVALGLMAKSVESASNYPLPITLLPFLGSGFVPTDTMPAGLRWFAEYQPFTPIIETVRGLLMGTPIGNSAWWAIGWCVGIALVGFLWALKLYNRDPTGQRTRLLAA